MSPQLASLPWQCGGVAAINVWRSAAAAPLLGSKSWQSLQVAGRACRNQHVCLFQTTVAASQCSPHSPLVETSHRFGRTSASNKQQTKVDGRLHSHASTVSSNENHLNSLCQHYSHSQRPPCTISKKFLKNSPANLSTLDAVTNLPGQRHSLKSSSVAIKVALYSHSQPVTSIHQNSSSHQPISFKMTGSLHTSSSFHRPSLNSATTATPSSYLQSSRHYCWACSSSCLVPPSRQSSRSLSLSASSNQDKTAGLNVFDRHTKLLQKERVAAREDAHLFDYLKDEVGFRLADRIFDIKKEFKVGLDLGCGRGHLSKHLTDASLQQLIMSDCSPGLLSSASAPSSPGLTVERRHVDEEQPLPFTDASLDLVLSNLSLSWVNNLPGCLREVHRTLLPGGTLLASMFGGDTLYQLRSALLLAEMERQGGVSAHVSPFTKVQDIGALLNQAGFEMLTIDSDDINVGYPSMWELLWDLQGMAESNASIGRCLHLPRDTLMAAAALYQELYGENKGVPATFQIIYMIGWKPDPNNVALPAARGSGEVSLKDIGRLEELVRERGLQGKMQFIEELDKGGRDAKGTGDDGKDK